MDEAAFSISKKWVRHLAILLLGSLVLLGIVRACYFSSETESEYFLIARNINWDDLRFTGKERNILAFAEELVIAASKEANLRVHFVTTDSHKLLEDLRIDKFDAVFTFMVPSSLNRDVYYFSDPLYMYGAVLVVREDSDARSLEDMEGKIVGIGTETSSVYEVAHYPSLVILTYENINIALNDLANNKIDGVIMDNWAAHASIQGFFAEKLKVVSVPFTRQGLRLITLKSAHSEEFIKSFNDGLERVKMSSQYQELIQKWDLYDVQ